MAQLLGGRTPVGFHEADDHVGAPLLSPVTLVEHGVGLADACRGSQVDAKMAGRFDDISGVVLLCSRRRPVNACVYRI